MRTPPGEARMVEDLCARRAGHPRAPRALGRRAGGPADCRPRGAGCWRRGACAMTSDRPYRAAVGSAHAGEICSQSGRLFVDHRGCLQPLLRRDIFKVLQTYRALDPRHLNHASPIPGSACARRPESPVHNGAMRAPFRGASSPPTVPVGRKTSAPFQRAGLASNSGRANHSAPHRHRHDERQRG
jgi:hypothetical protein